MTPILFLDIDGVLATEATHFEHGVFDPLCVRALNMLHERLQPDIVVSSTWRYGLNLRGLRQLFKQQGVRMPVIGSTPSCFRGGHKHGLVTSSTRGDEIAAWLTAYPTERPILIIDDDKDMGALQDRLIQTESVRGLTFEDVDRAVALLMSVPA